MEIVYLEQHWCINNLDILEVFEQIDNSLVPLFLLVRQFLKVNIGDLSTVGIHNDRCSQLGRVFKSQSGVLALQEVALQVLVWVKVNESFALREILDEPNSRWVRIRVKRVHYL